MKLDLKVWGLVLYNQNFQIIFLNVYYLFHLQGIGKDVLGYRYDKIQERIYYFYRYIVSTHFPFQLFRVKRNVEYFLPI